MITLSAFKSAKCLVLLAVLGVTVAGATGCASTGMGSPTVSSRATRFGAFPIDEEIGQATSSAHPQQQIGARRGYGYMGG